MGSLAIEEERVGHWTSWVTGAHLEPGCQLASCRLLCDFSFKEKESHCISSLDSYVDTQSPTGGFADHGHSWSQSQWFVILQTNTSDSPLCYCFGRGSKWSTRQSVAQFENWHVSEKLGLWRTHERPLETESFCSTEALNSGFWT